MLIRIMLYFFQGKIFDFFAFECFQQVCFRHLDGGRYFVRFFSFGFAHDTFAYPATRIEP